MRYAYATLQYPCVSDSPLTFLPIFHGTAYPDTQIGQLNPDFYLRGHESNGLPWISISYQTLLYLSIFIANTSLYVGRWNIADLKGNDNFGSGENLLGKWKHLLGKCFQSTCLGQLNGKNIFLAQYTDESGFTTLSMNNDLH